MAIEFIASTQAVADALNIVSAASSAKPISPYMGCVLISAKGNQVRFTASNGALSIQHTLSDTGAHQDANLRILQEGECLISATYLTDAVTRLAGETVRIATVDGNLTAIESGGAKFRINGIAPTEFPQISIPDATPLVIDAPLARIGDMFKRTAFATAKKTTREILTGVCLSADSEDAMYVTATDSFRLSRLAIRKADGVTIGAQFPECVVPVTTISALTSALKGERAVLRTDGKVLSAFDDNATALMSALLESAYPDVTRLIPTEFEAEAQFNRAELMDAAERSLFIRTDSVSVVSFDLSVDGALMMSRSLEIGAYKQDLNVERYEGAPLKISLNGGYLVQALKALNGDSVTLHFKGALKPIVVEGTDGTDNVQLLLPVRTQDFQREF